MVFLNPICDLFVSVSAQYETNINTVRKKNIINGVMNMGNSFD